MNKTCPSKRRGSRDRRDGKIRSPIGAIVAMKGSMIATIVVRTFTVISAKVVNRA